MKSHSRSAGTSADPPVTRGGSLKLCSSPSRSSLRASTSRKQDLEGYLAEALSQGGDYADLYFEYLLTSSISIDESMVKSAAQGVSMGVGIRVIAGERTGYAYSDDLSPEKIRKAARVAAHIASGPSKVEKFDLNEGVAAQPLPGPDRADRDGLRRARGTGEARRPRRAGLRSAHFPGAGGLRRQSAARAWSRPARAF